ncbi:hypothetical protein ABIA35_000571 [Catenulispora sp. MAP12-49]|uniref:hypothetical protein n=1 Tax=Catenulispora sp. MAP12-49 TaxID=3156302 RepID=UPI00351715AB
MIHILGNTRAVEIPTDSGLGDAIATLVRFIDVHNTMSHPASYSLNYDNSNRSWTLKAQDCSAVGDEADRIDTIRAWTTVLDGGVTRLSEPQEHQGSTRRQLSAHGTLAGHTQVEIWTHIAETHNS